MSHNITDKTIALAGLFQCASMVSKIASKGIVDYHELETMVRSTLNLSPQNTVEVYSSVENLRNGFLPAGSDYLSIYVQDLFNAIYTLLDMSLAYYTWQKN